MIAFHIKGFWQWPEMFCSAFIICGNIWFWQLWDSSAPCSHNKECVETKLFSSLSFEFAPNETLWGCFLNVPDENEESFLLNAELSVGKPSDERLIFCFELCMLGECSSVSTLNLKLRPASQQLCTSCCNYYACSLDIFHRASQIAKFSLRGGVGGKAKRKRSCGNSITLTHSSILFNTTITGCDQLGI